MFENTFSKFCTRIFVRALGLDICCFIATFFCISAGGGKAVRILMQIACIIAIVSFLYPVCHKAGDLDSPLVASGHKKHCVLKGLYAGIVATIPSLVSGIILLIAKAFSIIPNFASYYKIINSFFFSYLYSIMPVDFSINEMSYTVIFSALIILAVIPLICMFAYILGFNRFSFSEKILYKRKEI